MKTKLLLLIVGVFIISCSNNVSFGQSSRMNKFETEIIVFFLSDSLELPKTAKGIVGIQNAIVGSNELQQVISALNVRGIEKSFPKWENADTVVLSEDGIQVKRPNFDRV